MPFVSLQWRMVQKKPVMAYGALPVKSVSKLKQRDGKKGCW